ncbi:MAG: Hsp20/alpha crystallin family protein [Chromatiaceae bacterium]|nr:Hsp20/alpha crystallin family protein [Chromatiaceae bacterium]MCP5314452.1 Hsp20/alpha crystallin family protein [Chromatiaceae bacterium]
MNKRVVKQSLVAVALLGTIGAVGAAAYRSHETAEHLAVEEPSQQLEVVPDATTALRDPWAGLHADMLRMQTQMDQMFASVLGDVHAVRSDNQQTGAQVTLEEQGDNYVVNAEIPGAGENDVNVKLDGRLLSISSESHGSEKQTADDGQLIRQESFTRSFQQSFTLPGPVDASGMKTQFHDDVLTVTVPKIAS